MSESTGIVVKISNGNECLFKKSCPAPGSNNLKSLASDLRDMQQKVNACLTTLVEKGEGAANTQSSSDSDLDADEEDPTELSPKKCKISD